ncbi:hypothetical protein RFI_28972 [Reticulomyxa filosa]|uniref:Uncharacterized protein n=1 Tax=Reticulomyxa filosa TaxID=46433 RepID=X6M3B6_RETFI|nr:hypothetical protein RFI_28972 [Reticulomyxa filosa]|eukprot:ETO08414.1 hypothetical protein RFI_28972 [Reticulomyxa filosa]
MVMLYVISQYRHTKDTWKHFQNKICYDFSCLIWWKILLQFDCFFQCKKKNDYRQQKQDTYKNINTAVLERMNALQKLQKKKKVDVQTISRKLMSESSMIN